MKPIVLFAALFFISLNSFAQSTATITSTNSLMIPSDGSTVIYSVSKASLGAVESFASKTGEVQSYTISFKLGGDFFTKKVEGKLLPADVRSRLVGNAVGTKFYLDDVNIKAYTNPAISTSKAQFILTE